MEGVFPTERNGGRPFLGRPTLRFLRVGILEADLFLLAPISEDFFSSSSSPSCR